MNSNMNNWSCSNGSVISERDNTAYLGSNMVPALSPYTDNHNTTYFSSPPPPASRSHLNTLTTPPVHSAYWSSSSSLHHEDCVSACSSSITNTPELETYQTFHLQQQPNNNNYGELIMEAPTVDPTLFTSNNTNQANAPQQLMMPLLSHEVQHFYQPVFAPIPVYATSGQVLSSGGGDDISYAMYPNVIVSFVQSAKVSYNEPNQMSNYSNGHSPTSYGYYRYTPNSSSSNSSLYSASPSPMMKPTAERNTLTRNSYSTSSYNYPHPHQQQLNYNNHYSPPSPSIEYEQHDNDFSSQPPSNQEQQQQQDNLMTAENDNAIYRCMEPNCNKLFSRAYNLKSHATVHNNTRPYACNFKPCGWRFARPHDLKRHELQHTGQKPHSCNFCHRRFARSDALKRHWKVDATCAQALKEAGGFVVTKRKRSPASKKK